MREKQSHFEEVFLPHLDRAYNLARWLIESDQDAQAMVQEAYRQAVREFGKLGEADPRDWLLAIVRKKAYTWLQKGATGSKVVPFAEAFAGGPSAAAKGMADRSEKPVSEVPDQEWKRSLYEALGRLPVEFREILVLRDIEGWTYTQLASVLAVPRATVLHRLSTARRTLRQELGEAHRRELSDG